MTNVYNVEILVPEENRDGKTDCRKQKRPKGISGPDYNAHCLIPIIYRRKRCFFSRLQFISHFYIKSFIKLHLCICIYIIS
jgi:hypothetical protein